MPETSPKTSPTDAELLALKAYEDFELSIDGFKGTPDEIEQQWYEQVYLGRGDILPQLTVRAIVMGSLLGGLLSLTNLYAGLKTGWSFGVSITASILSYAIWTAFYKAGIVKSQMGILETNCMKATSSSAGYSTGGTLISAYAAYMLLNHTTLTIPVLMAWVFFIAIMGVTMAIPMKRQMVNIEQLRFPSGIACAETLKVLYSQGAKGLRAAKALIISGVAAAAIKFWEEGFELIRLGAYSMASLQDRINQAFFGSSFRSWSDRTVMFALDPMLLAAGALTGMKVSLSMFIGGTLCWVVFVPIMQSQGIIPPSPLAYRDIIQWPLWGGVSCMVTSGLLAFALQWKSIGKAVGNMGKIFSKEDAHARSEVDKLEAPISWFFWGQFVSLIALAWLSAVCFEIPVWQSVLAVFLTFFLALVSCRITGETDTTPIGAMGKVMQLIFGGLNPGKMNINLMAANITAGAASSSGDLLTDLKTGYLLGANPRLQFLAQFAGIFMGTVVTVISFRVLVPDYTALGTAQFPAPSAMTWQAVAIAMSDGIGNLHPVKIWLIIIGGLVGIILPLLSKFFPKYNNWIPSPAGLGLSWTFFWHSSLMFFLGALINYILEKKSPKTAEAYTFPVASGLIAGVALMGVFLAFVKNGPEILHQLLSGG
jgi:OPT family oligopeptide transporter